MSIVSRTACPGRASRFGSSGPCGRPSESTESAPARLAPRRYSSNFASTPAFPTLSPGGRASDGCRAPTARPRRRSRAPAPRAAGAGSGGGTSAGSGRPGTRPGARRDTRPGPRRPPSSLIGLSGSAIRSSTSFARRDGGPLEHPGETLDDVVAPLLGRSPTRASPRCPRCCRRSASRCGRGSSRVAPRSGSCGAGSPALRRGRCRRRGPGATRAGRRAPRRSRARRRRGRRPVARDPASAGTAPRRSESGGRKRVDALRRSP